MNIRRFIIIIASLILLFIGLMVYNATLGRDTLRPKLNDAVSGISRVRALSLLAQQSATNNTLRVAASTTASTTMSDNTYLTAYFQERYGDLPEVPPVAPTLDPATILKSTRLGDSFDAKYVELVTIELNASLERLKSLTGETQDPDLKSIIKTAIENHTVAIKQLQI